MKNLSFFAVLALSGLLSCENFFCPTPPNRKDYTPNLPPLLDSIAAGIDSAGTAGFWIFFRPDPTDTSMDMDSLLLYEKAGNDTLDTTYQLVYRRIPIEPRKVFISGIDFPPYLSTLSYSHIYRMVAQDTADPPNFSAPSAPETLMVCKQADLRIPADNINTNEVNEFTWRIDNLGKGYISYFGISDKDSSLWSDAAVPFYPEGYTSPEILLGNYEYADYRMFQSATIGELKAGTYYWWVRILWKGNNGAQSIVARKFVIYE